LKVQTSAPVSSPVNMLEMLPGYFFSHRINISGPVPYQ